MTHSNTAQPPLPRLPELQLGSKGLPTVDVHHEVLDLEGILVETYGIQSSRPPLLMVHGGCQGSWAWHKVGPRLASEGWFVVCLNWFGHYGSTALPPALALRRSILEVTKEIGEVADYFDRKPVLVGHSMGGLASLAYAGAQPLAALVLLAPVVPAAFAAEPVDLPVDPTTMWFPPPQLVDHAWWGDVSADEARLYRSLLCPESPRAVREATQWLCHVDTSSLVHIPTLVIGAEDDLLVPPHAVRALANSVAADYVELSATGHGIPLNPVWVDATATMLNWLPRHT